MKGKVEDKLAQLAFGELGPSEAAQLERQVQNDPEALRALSLYKEMRDGLRSLSDVPEDQFSKERLRDAILTGGLRPVPNRPESNRVWLWMPAMACVLGFTLMFGQNLIHKPKARTELVLNEDRLLPRLSTNNSIEMPAKDLANSKYGPFAPPALKPVASASLATKTVDPDEVDRRIIAENVDDDAYDPDLGHLPSGSAALAGGTVAVSRTPASHTSASSGPIVLIDQDTDEQTGACKATEVGSSSNVLVGG
jgi:hypothetical protein